jgi:hypothetical protein
VSVEMTLVRFEITLCVWKSSACKNLTRAYEMHTLLCKNPNLDILFVQNSHSCVLKSHSGVFSKKNLRVLAKIYLKIDAHACEFHNRTCHFHTQFITVHIVKKNYGTDSFFFFCRTQYKQYLFLSCSHFKLATIRSS